MNNNKKIHSIYPITCPDKQIRLFLKKKIYYSSFVHESIQGYRKTELINKGVISHYTFRSLKEINNKLKKYTDLAAQDAIERGKIGHVLNAFIHGIGAFGKWYFRKESYKDGWPGVICGIYAFRYTWYKYMKIKHHRSKY